MSFSIDTEEPAPQVQPSEGAEGAAAEKRSYGQILKSSAMIGGSQALAIAIGIIRTKAMAVLLGPSGVGLAGLYMSIANVAQGVAGMGVNSSGVRQIAEAAGSEDAERIARTAVTLRRTSVLLGVLGALVLLLFAAPISSITFGDNGRITGIYWLAAAVFLSLVSAGQGALLQGMRRIYDLAKMNVLGALFGTIATIPLVYFFREDGVVPSLVAVAGMTLAASWWYGRKIPIGTTSATISQVWQEASALLKLGIAFMLSGLLMMGSAYVIRIIVLHKAGLEATGLYQSAWALGGLYVGMILQSMGADFYPRLTAIVHDHAHCNRLVNEQARISMLLAGPGVIATFVFAPVVLSVFYAAKFGAAVEVLRWISLGIAARVISWPMGFIIMAKGEQWMLIFSELGWTIVHLGLAWILLGKFGLAGAGMAFFGAYVFHVILNYCFVRRLTGFRWSSANSRIGLLYLAGTAIVSCSFIFLPSFIALFVGSLAVCLSGLYSFRAIAKLVSSHSIPLPLSGVFGRMLPAFSTANRRDRGKSRLFASEQ